MGQNAIEKKREKSKETRRMREIERKRSIGKRKLHEK
jgi:hypothetical protein